MIWTARPRQLDRRRYARCQAAAADRNQDCRHCRTLFEDLEPGGALPGNDPPDGRTAAPSSARARSLPPLPASSVRSTSSPRRSTSAPNARVPATFTCGAVVGMTTTAGALSSRAASATACPWFPDENVITPRRRCSVGQLRNHVVSAANLEGSPGLRVLALQEERPSCQRRHIEQTGVTRADACDPAGGSTDILERDVIDGRSSTDVSADGLAGGGREWRRPLLRRVGPSQKALDVLLCTCCMRRGGGSRQCEHLAQAG